MTGFVPLFGYQPNRAGTDAFLSTLDKPTLALAGPDLALDESKDVFLGNALLQVSPGWKRGAQTIGSCCGWGFGLAVDVLAACALGADGGELHLGLWYFNGHHTTMSYCKVMGA